MAIKVLKREQQIQPVGVVKSNTFDANAELAKDIAQASTKFMGLAFERGAEEARQRGEEFAKGVQIPVLNADKGFIEVVEAPKTFGRIATNRFNEIMGKRYEDSIEHAMRKEFAVLSKQPDLRSNPALFKEKATELLGQFIENSDSQFQGLIKQRGEVLVGAGMADVQIRQHKISWENISYETEGNLITEISEMQALIQAGRPDEAFELLNSIIVKADESKEADILNNTQYNQIKNRASQYVLTSTISRWSENKTKSQIADEHLKWGNGQWRTGGMTKEIQEVINRLPKDMHYVKAFEEVDRHFNMLRNLTPKATVPVAWGSKSNRNIAFFADVPKNQGGGIDYSSTEYKRRVEELGVIDALLYEETRKYGANLIPDVTGKGGFKLYQIWSSIVIDRDPSGLGDTMTNHDYFHEDFHKMMKAVRPYMDINTNPEQFKLAVSWYMKTQEDKDQWVQTLGAELGIDKPTENNIKSGVVSLLTDQSWVADTFGLYHEMSQEEANLFVDEVILMQAMSSFTGNKLSIHDAIKKVANTVNADFGYDVGLINPNNIPAWKKTKSGWMDTSRRAYETPLYIKGVKNQYYQRSPFALSVVFKDNPRGEARFKQTLENVLDTYNQTGEGFRGKSGYKYGEHIFIQPHSMSTKSNPMYNVLLLNEATGQREPAIVNGQLLSINVSDINAVLASEEVQKESIHAKAGYEWKNRVAKEMGLLMKQRELTASYNTSGGFGAGVIDLENLDFDNYYDTIVDSLVGVTDTLHAMIFGQESKASVGEGIKSLQRYNPTNIKYDAENDWIGRLPKNGQFENFVDNAHAFSATYKILQTYEKEHFKFQMTVPKMITRWAPPQENDTKSYIRHVLSSTGLSETDIIDTEDLELMRKIIRVMTLHEVGYNSFMSYDEWDEDIEEGIGIARK